MIYVFEGKQKWEKSVLDPTILVSQVPPNVPHERSSPISQWRLYHVKNMRTVVENYVFGLRKLFVYM